MQENFYSPIFLLIKMQRFTVLDEIITSYYIPDQNKLSIWFSSATVWLPICCNIWGKQTQ